MAYQFQASWAQEIADVTGEPDYQNCEIQIRNPELVVRTGNPIDGYEYSGNPVLHTCRARIIGIRAALDIMAGTTANPSGSKSVRVQIPYAEYPHRINRGFQLRVTDGGRNPVLEQYVLTVESDFNAGNQATQTIECSIALDNEPVWRD